MKKRKLSKWLVALFATVLVNCGFFFYVGVAEEPGGNKTCYKSYSLGDGGIWYCPTGYGGSCTHVTDAGVYTIKSSCYSKDPA